MRSHVPADGRCHPVPTPAIAEMQRALETAVEHEWSTADGAQLLADARALQRLTNQLDALRATVTGELDRSGYWAERGHRTCAALLSKHSPGRHDSGHRTDVRQGRQLGQMPVVAEAFRSGEITTDHVRVLGSCLDPRFGGRLAEFEEELVAFAIDLPWKDWSALISLWKDAADDTDPDAGDERDMQAREVHLSRTLDDRGVLSATLTPHARQVVSAELDRINEELFRDDWAAAVAEFGQGRVRADMLGRTAAQRRHDALLVMAERSAAAGAHPARPEPRVYVHCTEQEFSAALERAAGGAPDVGDYRQRIREYEDGAPLSRRMLARLAVQGVVKRVVWDAAGQVIDLGRGSRLFSRVQREVIAVRDRVCRCGCGLSARLCEADHILEVRDGGETLAVNGQPLCHKSHRLKTLARSANETDRPISPDG